VVTVPIVVDDDADAEHDDPEQGWTTPKMLKGFEVVEVIPGLVATSVYPVPVALIDRFVNAATPALASTVVVPDSEPDPGFIPMATVTAAVELVASWPDPSRTSTLIGPPWESKAEVITALTTVLAGSVVNASEHDPVTEPERFPALAGSSRKLLPEPLKSFDCLASIPHW
jgi:hypothetical protein